ncbi:MAG: peroxiredoxin [Puniceicoccales bacterium]|jgi:peroxiredoxin (alkyl hydroperoxide reductase subunit C)|nr:peroxiredoxin [Puniceicoccales bacterium]
MRTLVGKKAPEFSATAVVNGGCIVQDFSLGQFLWEKYVVLFFYPKDFTFVCPTEIWAFQEKLPEFEKRNVALIGCSTDSEYSHFAWLETPRASGGIAGVTFPLVSDINKTIAGDYGVLAGEYEEDGEGDPKIIGELVAYRGLFLIDKNGIIQHCVINNMPLGRSVDETLRMVDALQHFERCGEVCPANWHRGQKSMKPTKDGLGEFFG